MTNASWYYVELDGKREGSSCVEANVDEGWVRREWTVGRITRSRKFYGKVFIVRYRGLSNS